MPAHPTPRRPGPARARGPPSLPGCDQGAWPEYGVGHRIPQTRKRSTPGGVPRGATPLPRNPCHVSASGPRHRNFGKCSRSHPAPGLHLDLVARSRYAPC
eukprot:6544217-Pyramimonas_sp.AAC.1